MKSRLGFKGVTSHRSGLVAGLRTKFASRSRQPGGVDQRLRPHTRRDEEAGNERAAHIHFRVYVSPVVNWNEFFLKPSGGLFKKLSEIAVVKPSRLKTGTETDAPAAAE